MIAPYGTTYERDHDGRLARVIDRAGYVWATLAWDGDRLVRLEVPGAIVDGARIEDPLLGEAHRITSGDATTTMTALDWAAPAQIPTVAAPGRLVAGAGGAILNVIALLAADSGIDPLRYAGRYPTSALFRALARSFRTTATEDDFTAHLSERLGERLGAAGEPIPVDFVPAPLERLGNPHGFLELRVGLERAVIDRVSYEPGGSPARLVELRAELWFGDQVYARVAAFDVHGELLDGPLPLPRCTSEVVGQQFPPALAGALAELVAQAVPAPLAADARRWLATRPVRWADLGARAARAEPDGLAVHAALWQTVGPLGLGRLALALAEALAPVVTTALVAEIEREVDLFTRSPGTGA